MMMMRILCIFLLLLFSFMLEFNLYSWWYSDLTAKGKWVVGSGVFRGQLLVGRARHTQL